MTSYPNKAYQEIRLATNSSDDTNTNLYILQARLLEYCNCVTSNPKEAKCLFNVVSILQSIVIDETEQVNQSAKVQEVVEPRLTSSKPQSSNETYKKSAWFKLPFSAYKILQNSKKPKKRPDDFSQEMNINYYDIDTSSNDNNLPLDTPLIPEITERGVPYNYEDPVLLMIDDVDSVTNISEDEQYFDEPEFTEDTLDVITDSDDDEFDEDNPDAFWGNNKIKHIPSEFNYKLKRKAHSMMNLQYNPELYDDYMDSDEAKELGIRYNVYNYIFRSDFTGQWFKYYHYYQIPTKRASSGIRYVGKEIATKKDHLKLQRIIKEKRDKHPAFGIKEIGSSRAKWDEWHDCASML